jgi:hypothetical protein
VAHPHGAHAPKLPPRLHLADAAAAAATCKALVAAFFDGECPAVVAARGATDRQRRAVARWLQPSSSTSSAAPVMVRESVQLGTTKVFFRKAAHDALEGRRTRRLTAAACLVQAAARRYLCRAAYARARRAVVTAQRAMRGHRARQVARALKRALLRVQAFARRALVRCRRRRFFLALVRLQSRCRGRRAVRALASWSRARQAGRLQRAVLTWLCARRWRRYRRAVLALQCGWRRRWARAERARRVAAREASLRASHAALQRDYEALQTAHAAALEEIAELTRRLAAADAAAAAATAQVEVLQAQAAAMAAVAAEATDAADENRAVNGDGSGSGGSGYASPELVRKKFAEVRARGVAGARGAAAAAPSSGGSSGSGGCGGGGAEGADEEWRRGRLKAVAVNATAALTPHPLL